MGRPVLAWYALGGGLGHLQRALAILRHLRGPEVLLLTSSPYAFLAVRAGVPTLRLPGKAEAALLPAGTVPGLVRAAVAGAGMLVVDTFGEGLYGELPELLPLVAGPRVLVARERSDGGHTAGYDLVVSPHDAPVVLRRPEEALTRAQARAALGLEGEAAGAWPPGASSEAGGTRPLIMAMHAGDEGEVAGFFQQVQAASALLDLPHDLRLLTPLPVRGIDAHHFHPAAELLPAADLVVCGAGYNSHAEVVLFGKRALFCPFERRHDRQHLRAQGRETFTPRDDARTIAARMRAALAAPAPPPVAAPDGAKAIAALLAARYNGTP